MLHHSHDSLSSIIPLSNKNNSGSFTAPINVGPQLTARNAPLCHRLDGGPVLSVEQSLVSEPLGNGLLADRRTTHEFGDTLSKSRLAARDLDSAPQGDNVLLFHRAREYTTKVVRVNNFKRVHSGAEICTVLAMGAPVRKRPIPPRSKVPTPVIRDTEGLSLGDRLRIGMQAKSRMTGRPYNAKDLLTEASCLIGRGPDDPPIQTQQALSKIMNDLVSESAATPAYAQVLGLNPLWLGYGVGPRCVIDTIEKPRK